MAMDSEIKFPVNFFDMEELGYIIKRVRVMRGFTQYELAMQTNTSTKFISNVENGKKTANMGKVLLLIRVLNLGAQLLDLKRKEG
ncbi:MAG: helix-turn-helix domain-containing protein [Candidatus Adiutrix sp.]